MEVKTSVFLSEEDIRAIIKKHLEKQGYKVIGELEIITPRNYNPRSSKSGDKLGISAEVQKLFKNRISLPTNK
jgi:hypothetical protein